VPKTITVRREGRRWFVTVFCVGMPAQPLPETGRVAGIDLGIASLAVASDGTAVPNHRPGRRAAGRLRTARRDYATKRRGSLRRRRAARRIGALHRKAARQRLDHLHKASRALVGRFDLIVHEDLRIADMTRRPKPRPDGEGGYAPNRGAQKSGLNRSILDAGWGTLLRLIAYKAEDAGRQVIAVDPRYTSQTCSACGHVDGANRVSQAVFRCLGCRFTCDADLNAAINILGAGLALREARAEREARDVA
jgi:putative transposase